MGTEHWVTLATVAAITWAVGAVAALLLHVRVRPVASLVNALLGVAAVCGAVWLDSATSLGRNSVIGVSQALQSGDLRHLCSAGLGFCLGFGPALRPWQSSWSQAATGWVSGLRIAVCLGTVVASFGLVGLLALEDQIKPFLINRDLSSIITSPSGGPQSVKLIVEPYHTCQFRPVQIECGPDGDLYATGYKGPIAHAGVVARLSRDPESGQITELQIADNLTRIHGLAFHNGDLYVSRAGHFLRARNGALEGVNTGAVTVLRDLDGDSIIDYYDDIIDGLPGVQGPDQLHQNNGIRFGPDGDLYIAVGIPVNRGPAISEFEGTIVRCGPDGSNPTVYARGFRNPFDLVFGPGGELFATDNDPTDSRAGDELNHVVEGRHYGFPYADGSTSHPAGAQAPLMVNRQGTLQGITYADSPRLPSEFRDCLYVVSYGNGNIHRVRLKANGSTFDVESKVVATIAGALDITASDDGMLYVSCFASGEIYRLRFQGGDQ